MPAMSDKIIRKAQTGEPGNGGQFGHVTHADATDVALVPAPTNDSAVAGAALTPGAIGSVRDKLATISEDDLTRIVHAYREHRSYDTRDAHDAAWWSIHSMAEREAELTALDGRDGSDIDVVNPNRAAADAIYDDAYWQARQKGDDFRDEYFTAMSAANDAAVALVYRWKIGREDCPGWTQQAYDHLTTPWNAVFGKVHPLDEA